MKTIYKTIKKTARKYVLPTLVAGTLILGGCWRNSCKIEDSKCQDFPPEKMLTISADEYCRMYNKKLEDFIAVGVEGKYINYCHDEYGRKKSRIVPEETEVVVGYSFQHSPYCEKGTALIPRQKPLNEKNNYVLTRQ